MPVTFPLRSDLSTQQGAVIDWVRDGAGSLNLIAYAGTGKTSTLMEVAKVITGNGFMGSFNKSIADEFVSRLAAQRSYHVKGSTLHSAGNSAWRKVAPRVGKPDDSKMRSIARNLVSWDRKLAGAVVETVGYAKQACLGCEGVADFMEEKPWLDLIEYYDIEIPTGIKPGMLVEYCQKAYQQSLDACEVAWDFNDMLLAPLYFKAPFQKYDWIMIDECFVGDTPVMLSSGENQTIKELVDTRADFYVSTYDYESGKTVPRKIIGWHKIPLTKKLVKLTTRRVLFGSKGQRLGKLTEYARNQHRFIICTEDQLVANMQTPDLGCAVWTNAVDLKPGTFVIEESHAKKDAKFQDKYKHSILGRRTLSDLMTAKNKSGACGSSRTGGVVSKRGGNGTGATVYQEALLQRLGDGWIEEYAVPTKQKRGSSYPTCYKLDLANPVAMVGIELDGGSHKSKARQDQDAKKDGLLTSLGWTIIRVTNQESIVLTEELLMEKLSNSPVPAEVVAVEPFEPQDPFVYDIDVEDTHNFYANGVLVHNCQDTNTARRMVSLAMAHEGTRIIAVGDPFQSIYHFAGASSDAMELIADAMRARGEFTELPLSVTYRCPRAVVDLAQEWVPDFEAAPTAPEGAVELVDHEQFLDGDFFKFDIDNDVVLCRNTRPLIGVASVLRKQNIPCVVEGQSGKVLKALAVKWGEDIKIGDWLILLGRYQAEEIDRYTKKNDLEKVEYVTDKCESIRDMAISVGEGKGVQDLVRHIDFLFGDSYKRALHLCTVHKSKGREWKRVFLVGRNRYMPSPWAKNEAELAQEHNLAYVAVTRTKETLVEVDVPFKKRGEAEWWEE